MHSNARQTLSPVHFSWADPRHYHGAPLQPSTGHRRVLRVRRTEPTPPAIITPISARRARPMARPRNRQQPLGGKISRQTPPSAKIRSASQRRQSSRAWGLPNARTPTTRLRSPPHNDARPRPRQRTEIRRKSTHSPGRLRAVTPSRSKCQSIGRSSAPVSSGGISGFAS